MTANGQVRYELKTPYRNGATHVIFERGDLPPWDFKAKLAALVAKPRVNLTRFHGVFAPNSKHRVQVTMAKRGKKPDPERPDTDHDKSPAERHRAMTWLQRLKRVFNIDIEVRQHCGGQFKVIASIEAPPLVPGLFDPSQTRLFN